MDGTSSDSQEIRFIDYIRVIIKRKKLIFLVFLVTLIGVAIFSFFSPKIYSVELVLKIGSLEGSMLESPTQVVGEITENIYSSLLAEKTGIAEWQYPKIKPRNPAGTNLVELKMDSAAPQELKGILEQVGSAIVLAHQEKIKTRQDLIQNSIKTKESQIKLTESDIESTKNKNTLTEQDIEREQVKMKYLEAEKKILEDKEKALEQTMPYQQLSQQVTGSLFILLDVREKLNSKKQEIENLYLTVNSLRRLAEDGNFRLSTLKAERENLENEVNSFRISLASIEPTKIVKAPIIHGKPVRPQIVFNLAVGAALGLFLGICLAYLKEWWQNNRAKLVL